MKANLASSSSSEGVAFRRRNLPSPWEAVRGGGGWRSPVLKGSSMAKAKREPRCVTSPCLLLFWWLLQQVQSVGVWIHLLVCAVTRTGAAISYLCLFGWTCYLVCLAIFGSNIPWYRPVVRIPVNFRESLNLRRHWFSCKDSVENLWKFTANRKPSGSGYPRKNLLFCKEIKRSK